MGQHKYNETAILAKEGKLPPRKPKVGSVGSGRIMQRLIQDKIFEFIAKKAAEETTPAVTDNEYDKIIGDIL